MNKPEFSERVTTILCSGREVACRMGRVRVFERPPSTGRNPRTGDLVLVPARKHARFYPSAMLVTAAFGQRGVPASVYERRRPTSSTDVYGYDLFSAVDIPDDLREDYVERLDLMASGERDVVALEEERLFDEVVDALTRGRAFRISGFGSIEQRSLPRFDSVPDVAVADADLAGLRIVYVRFSPVLTEKLNPVDG